MVFICNGIFIWFAKFGCLLHFFADVIVDFFTNTALLLWLGTLALAILGVGFASTVIVYLCNRLLESNFGQRVYESISFKVNGFGDARRKLKAIREAEEMSRAEELKRPGFFARLLIPLDRYAVKIGGATKIVLGPFGILWEFLKALKNGVCPMVEFLDVPTISASVVEDKKE